MTNLQQTAIHESGHVVAAFVLHGRVSYVYALDGHSLNGCRGAATVGHDDPDIDAAICFGGGVAAAFGGGVDYSFFDGEFCLAWTDSDVKKTLAPSTSGLVKTRTPAPATTAALEADIHHGRRHDMMDAWQTLRKASHSDAEAVKRFDKAQHRAMEVVAMNLPVIRALAGVLEYEHVLSAEQVNGFLQRSRIEREGNPRGTLGSFGAYFGQSTHGGVPEIN